MTRSKGYRGVGMEGPIATWYAKNTGRERDRFIRIARRLAANAPPRSKILEVAPGPGYLAVELATRGFSVTALDISAAFVKMARDNAAAAGVAVDVLHGNASAMPFEPNGFDAAVCVAAFKNFSDPVGAMNEMYRVLKPGGVAFIFDLRKDATREEIKAEVGRMHLSALNSVITRWTFELLLLKRAYTREQLEHFASRSRFSHADISADGIGLEVRLKKE